MRKIVEYSVVAGKLSSFGRAITKCIEEGWEVYGNPLFDPNDLMFYQAVVKYDEREIDDV